MIVLGVYKSWRWQHGMPGCAKTNMILELIAGGPEAPQKETMLLQKYYNMLLVISY